MLNEHFATIFRVLLGLPERRLRQNLEPGGTRCFVNLWTLLTPNHPQQDDDNDSLYTRVCRENFYTQ